MARTTQPEPLGARHYGCNGKMYVLTNADTILLSYRMKQASQPNSTPLKNLTVPVSFECPERTPCVVLWKANYSCLHV